MLTQYLHLLQFVGQLFPNRVSQCPPGRVYQLFLVKVWWDERGGVPVRADVGKAWNQRRWSKPDWSGPGAGRAVSGAGRAVSGAGREA